MRKRHIPSTGQTPHTITQRMGLKYTTQLSLIAIVVILAVSTYVIASLVQSSREQSKHGSGLDNYPVEGMVQTLVTTHIDFYFLILIFPLWPSDWFHSCVLMVRVFSHTLLLHCCITWVSDSGSLVCCNVMSAHVCYRHSVTAAYNTRQHWSSLVTGEGHLTCLRGQHNPTKIFC